jgi:hypothetical protein
MGDECKGLCPDYHLFLKMYVEIVLPMIGLQDDQGPNMEQLDSLYNEGQERRTFE